MRHEKRQRIRRNVHQPAVLVGDDGLMLGKCLMLNVSATGAKLERAALGAMPAHFILVLSQDGQLRRKCEVVWQSGSTMGVRFIRDDA